MRLAVGDTIATTNLVRSLKITYPNLKISGCLAGMEDVFKFNPYFDNFKANEPNVQICDVDYRHAIDLIKLGDKISFLEGILISFERMYGISVPFISPKPDLYLSEEELNEKLIEYEIYGVINCGYKTDMDTKYFGQERLQELINKINIPLVRLGKSEDTGRLRMIQPNFTNVIDLVNKTSLRQSFQIIKKAKFIITPVSYFMLVAEAFNKPCVVLAGGRESVYFHSYRKDNPAFDKVKNLIQIEHLYLNAENTLPCISKVGCYACTTWPPHNDSKFPDGFLCKNPYWPDNYVRAIPQCMQNIELEPILTYLNNI